MSHSFLLSAMDKYVYGIFSISEKIGKWIDRKRQKMKKFNKWINNQMLYHRIYGVDVASWLEYLKKYVLLWI